MTTWHATTEEITTYRRGSADSALAASVEAHLLVCSSCRAVLAGDVDARVETERRWDDLALRMQSPSSSIWSGLLRSGATRPALSTRPLLIAWLTAMALLVALPVLPIMVVGTGSTTMLLAAAPLAPMIAVVLSYRQATDPAGELALASPMAGFRLIATRAMVVALIATPVGVVVALVLQLPAYAAFGWLLPGLALAALVLMAGTVRVDPAVAAGVLGAAWALAVVVPTVARRSTADLVAQAVASPEIQLLALVIAVAAATLAVARRDHVTYRRAL